MFGYRKNYDVYESISIAVKFLIRREVLKVYKDIIKYVNRIDDATYRVELTKWARHDFRMNKKLTDQVNYFVLSVNLSQFDLLSGLLFILGSYKGRISSS